MTVLTDEIRALIGAESAPRTAAAPVSEEMLRRFVQAVMEEDPVHWDAEVAQESRYGTIVGTPLFPLHAFRRASGTPDPFDRFAEEPDNDGLLDLATTPGLPPIDLPLPRLLNGGSEAEFFRLAEVGDVITSRSSYADIFEKQGRDGSPLVFVRIATTYTNQHDEVLLVTTQTLIRR